MSTTRDAYRGGLDAVERLVNREPESAQVLAKTTEMLHDRFPHYSWVGIYLVDRDELVLGPWRGPQATEHVRIPIGSGICGAAAATGRTEVVDDVNADERYLACFLSTRSEIVVPIGYEGRVVGEIDIDSDEPAAFSEADREFLERVATLVSRHAAEVAADVADPTGAPFDPDPFGRA
jgi:L-methionine (R)-S-oxide reductase